MVNLELNLERMEPASMARRVTALLVLITLISGVDQAQAGPGDKPRNLLKQYPGLPRFFEAKEKQARKDTEAAKEQVAPEMWSFFKDVRDGNCTRARATWKKLAPRSGQYEGGTPDPTVRNAAWPPAMETDLVLEAFAEGNAKYADLFGRGIVESIPRGSIYFGGTDPGRGLVTAYVKSHVEGDPFFVVTQNALADGSYLQYLRRMYEGKIFTPSQEDSQKAFTDYITDAQRRLNHDQKFTNEPRQIKPGEDVRIVDNRVQVQGQVAVMAINALLARVIVDRNPDREIYIEESFPLEWMYPHLVPHAWIMKVNRSPLDALPEQVVRKDRDFWTLQVNAMIGDWLKPGTPVKEVCAFAEKVFLNHDLKGFSGNAEFVRDERASKSFSKLRSAQGGVYAWRMNNSKAGQADKELMKREADFAFRQAVVLCPSSPEAVFRYVNLLVTDGRSADALALAEMAGRLEPSNRQFADLARELRRMDGQGKR